MRKIKKMTNEANDKEFEKAIFSEEEIMEMDRRTKTEESILWEDVLNELGFDKFILEEIDKRASQIGKQRTFTSNDILKEFGYEWMLRLSNCIDTNCVFRLDIMRKQRDRCEYERIKSTHNQRITI